MAAMTPEQQALIQRIQSLVTDQSDVREVSMFGGRAIMVNDKMIVSAGKAADLLVRVDADQHDALLSEPGADGCGATHGARLDYCQLRSYR